MGTYNDIRSRFEAIQEAFRVSGYQRYSGYYVFSPPSGFAIGQPMRASDMNSMKDALQGGTRSLLYTTYPISSVVAGSAVSASLLTRIDQYKQDINDLRGCAGCSNTCTSTCYNGCHNCTGGCTGSCTGCSGCSGCKGCSGNCYSCKGGLWCVSCHGCTGCGGCRGCGGCSGNCQSACSGCTSCSTNCNTSCNVNCSGACRNSCSSGCSNSSRIGG
jgi:hypothetical protein